MGVKNDASCMSSRCGDMASVFMNCWEVVNEVGPPMTNCESSPSASPDGSKEKSAQLPVSLRESSGVKRLFVKVVEENGIVAGLESKLVESAAEKSVKSQLID
jgi:hypothetical protein